MDEGVRQHPDSAGLRSSQRRAYPSLLQFRIMNHDMGSLFLAPKYSPSLAHSQSARLYRRDFRIRSRGARLLVTAPTDDSGIRQPSVWCRGTLLTAITVCSMYLALDLAVLIFAALAFVGLLWVLWGESTRG